MQNQRVYESDKGTNSDVDARIQAMNVLLKIMQKQKCID